VKSRFITWVRSDSSASQDSCTFDCCSAELEKDGALYRGGSVVAASRGVRSKLISSGMKRRSSDIAEYSNSAPSHSA